MEKGKWIFDSANEQREQTGTGVFRFPVFDACRLDGLKEVTGVTEAQIRDAVKLGSWDEVDKIKTETIGVNTDVEKLDGAIFKAYETKFGKTNENGERYDKDCLDEFLQNYYVKNKLNLPVTIQHREDLMHLAGRVLLVEVNSVGFYFVVYIPRTYRYYEDVVNAIKNGVLQGLSKEGWAEDWENHWNEKTGEWEYCTIKKMRLTAMSIVAIPANGIGLEKAAEIKNALTFQKIINQTPNNNPAAASDPFADMFNH